MPERNRMVPLMMKAAKLRWAGPEALQEQARSKAKAGQEQSFAEQGRKKTDRGQ